MAVWLGKDFPKYQKKYHSCRCRKKAAEGVRKSNAIFLIQCRGSFDLRDVLMKDRPDRQTNSAHRNGIQPTWQVQAFELRPLAMLRRLRSNRHRSEVVINRSTEQ